MIVVSFFLSCSFEKYFSQKKFWSAIMNNAFCSFTAFWISINICHILSLSIFIFLSTSVVKGLPIAASLPRSVLRLTDLEEIGVSGMQGSCEGTTRMLLLAHQMLKIEELKCLPSVPICPEDGV